MCRTRKTVDATMFAPTVWIYRPIKRQIRRPIVSYDFSRNFVTCFGDKVRRQRLVPVPSILHAYSAHRLEPPFLVGQCGARFGPGDGTKRHANTVNKDRTNVNPGALYIRESHALTGRRGQMVAPDAERVAICIVFFGILPEMEPRLGQPGKTRGEQGKTDHVR